MIKNILNFFRIYFFFLLNTTIPATTATTATAPAIITGVEDLDSLASSWVFSASLFDSSFSVFVEGTDNKYLKYYACHFEGTAMPGEEGNFSVAGHSSYLYNQVFNELHKVKINDEIEIETTKGIFKYKITEKFDTEAENTSVLTQDMSKKEITLVTCTNGGKKRLIIKGEIME